eukprot:GHVU01010895.1.p1 GENE.GHVU01010895.1~~GHVU01010895.1.p1  ORF type:complete len:101 (+),score=7.37 GHVU01010895.1:261-563(+)
MIVSSFTASAQPDSRAVCTLVNRSVTCSFPILHTELFEDAFARLLTCCPLHNDISDPTTHLPLDPSEAPTAHQPTRAQLRPPSSCLNDLKQIYIDTHLHK